MNTKHSAFIFENYKFDDTKHEASFRYSFDGSRFFTERVFFHTSAEDYDKSVLDRALWLSFLLIGTSYYKSFPTRKVIFRNHKVSSQDAKLLNSVYRDGLSQFIFENGLEPDDMPVFVADDENRSKLSYPGNGVVLLQSGGKDSLLLSQILDEHDVSYTALHISSSKAYPVVLDKVGATSLRVVTRTIDKEAIQATREEGGLNGHVPVTYIVMALSLVDAILHDENTVLVAVGREGNEAHTFVGSLSVNHQWSKSWEAEQLFAAYVAETVSPDIRIGSSLRPLSELRIAELFVQHAWKKYGHDFSSCNRANYGQGHDNTSLTWCGVCPKCANSFLLFAPFVEPDELMSLFGGKNLFLEPDLENTFKGLLGIDGVMKPFECVGEVEELRLAYHMARQRYGEERYLLSFDVPPSDGFDYRALSLAQPWIDMY